MKKRITLCKNNKGFSAKRKVHSIELSPQNFQFCIIILKGKIKNFAKC